MASGEEYSYLYKREEDPEDAQKITRTRTVRNTISTRVLRGISPDSITSSATNPRNVLGSSPRQSRSRLTRATEQQQREAMSSDYKSSTYDDFPKDENQPPDQDDGALKRAQSEGDLLNGELKLRKIKKIRSLPSLERKVRFSSTERDEANAQKLHQRAEELAHGTYTDESIQKSDDGKKRSRSYDELSWKKPHIDVKRKVELLPQKERSRSADSPRKGILKTKRITQTNTIRVSGSIPLDQQGTTSDDLTKLGTETQSTSSSTEQEQMDYSTYSTTQTSGGQENVFQLPKRYRVQEDIELEPQTKPKGMIFTRRWKSEPFLVEKKQQRRSKSMERLPSEKETKLSNVKIDLIRPIDLKPLKPAYSVGDLSFETSKRSDEQFHLKLQRWKSNPELVSREKFDRKPGKEFETKIVRALPVHLQPLHQPNPAKETQVKTTEVKDTAMQATYVKHTKSEGTQAFLQTSPITIENEPVKYKSTQTMNMPEKLTVATPVVVEFQKSEIKQETPKVRRLKIKETTPDEMTEQEIEEQRRVEKEKRDHDMKQERLVVQYVPDKPRLKEQEWPTTEVCEEYATEVRLRRNVESKETKRGIEIGRIDDIDMEQAPVEEDYPETRRVKKMKTTHVEYRPSSEKNVRHVSEKQTRPREDITFGRIESTRKAVGVTTMDEPTAADRLRVEEITFPRRADSTTAAVEMQTQQGKKRKKETSVKYEKIPTDVIKVTRQSTEWEAPRCFVDEADEYQRKVKREPSIGRIEDLHVEEKTKVNGSFPTAPEIGSFIFKSVPDEQPHKVRRERKPKKKRTDHLHVRDVDYDEVHEQKIRPGTDHRKISREHVTTEKVTVSRRDMTTREESEKARYRKEQDIGRIIIEEIPEKEEMTKREVSRKEVVKPSPEVTVKRHEVEEIPRTRVREEVIKVRHTDVTPVESTMEKKVTTYLERADGVREEKRQDRVIKPRYIPDKRYEIHDETKKRREDTMVLGRDVSTEKVTVTRTDRIHREETELPKYPEEPCVGRIAIEEMPERREEKPREVHRKRDRTPRRTDVTEAERPYEKEEVIKVGKLDVHEAEKVPLESTRVGERAATYRERVEGSRKWVKTDKEIKVGKLDVTELEKTNLESQRVDKRVTTLEGNLMETLKPKKNQEQEKRIVEREERLKLIGTQLQEEEAKTKTDMAKADAVKIEKVKRPMYLKEQIIDLIVIEETTLGEDEKTTKVSTTAIVEPKAEVTVARKDVIEACKAHMKQGRMKVGKLDVHEWENAVKSNVGERSLTKQKTHSAKVVDEGDVTTVGTEQFVDDMPISNPHISKKISASGHDISSKEEPEKTHYRKKPDCVWMVTEKIPFKEVQAYGFYQKPKKSEVKHEIREEHSIDRFGVEYDKVFQETKPQPNDTRVSPEHVCSQNLTPSKLDTACAKKTEEPRNLKELDTEHTVIQEIPEKERNSSISKEKGIGWAMNAGIMLEECVVKNSGRQAERNAIKVGNLDATKMESENTEKRTIKKNQVYQKERSMENETLRTPNVTKTEKMTRVQYPIEEPHDRIIIVEISEDNDGKPGLYQKYLHKSKTTDVTLARNKVVTVSESCEKDTFEDGVLVVNHDGKTPMEAKQVEERFFKPIQIISPRTFGRGWMTNKQPIDRIDVKDVEYDAVSQKEKTVDNGSIAIEVTSVQNGEIPQRDMLRNLAAKERPYEVTCDTVHEVLNANPTQDLIRVGKLNTADQKKVSGQSEKPKQEGKRKLAPSQARNVKLYNDKSNSINPRVEGIAVSGQQMEAERISTRKSSKIQIHETATPKYFMKQHDS